MAKWWWVYCVPSCCSKYVKDFMLIVLTLVCRVSSMLALSTWQNTSPLVHRTAFRAFRQSKSLVPINRDHRITKVSIRTISWTLLSKDLSVCYYLSGIIVKTAKCIVEIHMSFSRASVGAICNFCLSSVLRPLQHSIGHMGDGFYRSKDPTNSIKVLKEKAAKENNTKKT